MIKRAAIVFLLLPVLFFKVNAQPKLVVGIVIDQMRYDYLTKYVNQYKDGGFKRFTSEGFCFNNHNYNYGPTLTGPGHASIYTGTTPAIHGIIANEWYDKKTKRTIYCAEDNSVNPIGTENKESRRSPVLLNTTTIGDQLRLYTDFQSKVIGIALKDRGAILPAGHRGNGAYWLDFSSGDFVTSSYYCKQLPNWVQQFNAQKLADHYLNQIWNLLLPESAYSEPDDVPYEKTFSGLQKSIFPYDLPKLKTVSGPGIIATTPFGNSLTVDFAIAAIEGEHLGTNKVPDMLNVSFSSPDYIGHQFGPQSREIHDMYIRLDKELKRFFDYLDHRFGKDNVLIFLTADHGAADAPAYVKSGTGFYNENKIKEQLNSVLNKKFGIDSLAESVSNLQVFLNHGLLRQKNISINEVTETCKQNIDMLQGIYDVLDARDMGNCPDVNLACQLLKNGINPKRSGDIILISEPGWLSDYSLKGGTTHGSLFNYDTHVPMLWLGWHIAHGNSYQLTAPQDIAPTLAQLLGCTAPNGTTGSLMIPLLEKEMNKAIKK